MGELLGLIVLGLIVYGAFAAAASAYEEGYRAGKREGSRKAYGVGYERGRREAPPSEATGCLMPLAALLAALLAAGIAFC